MPLRKKARVGSSSSSTPDRPRRDSHPTAPRSRPTPTPPKPHTVNKHKIVWLDDDQVDRYDTVATRPISAPKYLDADYLRSLDLWDDLALLFERLGWMDYTQLQYDVYERVVWEFMSSLHVDLAQNFGGGTGYIRFRLFDKTYSMNLARFNSLLRLPDRGVLAPVHNDFHPQNFWASITGSSQPYVARAAKGTLITNPILRYLQRLAANVVFPRRDSQNVVRLGELFLLWASLNRVEINTGAFIAVHLYDQATHGNTAIASGGIITAIAIALGHGDHFRVLPELCVHTLMDHKFCTSIGMFDQVGSSVWVLVHGMRWFRLPNRAKTSLSDPANLVFGPQHREDPDAVGGPDSPIDLDADPVSAAPTPQPTPPFPRIAHAPSFPTPSPRISPSEAGPSRPSGPSSDSVDAILERLDRLQASQDQISGQLIDLSHQALAFSERLRDVTSRQERMEYWFYYAYEYLGVPPPPPGWMPPPSE